MRPPATPPAAHELPSLRRRLRSAAIVVAIYAVAALALGLWLGPAGVGGLLGVGLTLAVFALRPDWRQRLERLGSGARGEPPGPS